MLLLHHYLRDTAARFGDKPALITGAHSHSFADMDGYSDRLACALQRIGVRRGDRVAVMEAIGEAAVIGVPDAIDGTAIKVFVRVRDGHHLTEQAVRQHCRGRLEPPLVPKYVEFRAELPKTDSGKITKTPLRAAGASTP